jgi:hypothetical protein
MESSLLLPDLVARIVQSCTCTLLPLFKGQNVILLPLTQSARFGNVNCAFWHINQAQSAIELSVFSLERYLHMVLLLNYWRESLSHNKFHLLLYSTYCTTTQSDSSSPQKVTGILSLSGEKRSHFVCIGSSHT